MKHTDNYYITRIKKILCDGFYFHSWCTPQSRGVYLTRGDGTRMYENTSREKLLYDLQNK